MPLSLAPPALSLRQLQYIVAVADLGGFRKAAEGCHVSQPSLSAQIARAERAIGLQIFDRGPRAHRGVVVTNAGRPMVEQARRVLVAAGDLVELARQRRDPFRGTLRIGLIPTVGPYLLPEIAPTLSRAFPDLTIIWSEERTSSLVRQINEGAIDGAILALEAELGDLEHTVLGWDPFVLAGAPGHPLMKHTRTPATLEALDGVRVLLLDDGHCFRDQALGLCARAGGTEMDFRATSLATLVQMVSASSGVTLLPLLALGVENRRGQLRVRPFKSPRLGRTLVLAWRKGSALRKPLEKIGGAMVIPCATSSSPPTGRRY